MILQALAAYCKRLNAAPYGFEDKGIPYVVVVDQSGTFRGIEPTGTVVGTRRVARTFRVPKAVKRSSNVAPNLLWDNPKYVFGWSADEDAHDKHSAFIDRIKRTFPEPVSDEGVSAVLRYLEHPDFQEVHSHRLWQEIAESGGNIAFKLDGDDRLVCQREAVTQAHLARIAELESEEQQCLITGAMDTIAATHTPIKGVWKAQPSGGNVVSFNQPSFESHGKTQGLNAPVGSKAEHAYTTALNHLLERSSRQKMRVGDATAVFWAERPHPMETYFSDFFGVLPKGISLQDTEGIRALFRAPETGVMPVFEDETKFYVLGLAPNASRLAVRFWHAGTVAKVARSIKQHFDDCRMVHRDFEPEHMTLATLLRSTALDGNDERIQPNLAGAVMKTILDGRIPYPATLLASVIRRIKAEQSRKFNGKITQNVTHARASLIKASLVRASRYYKRNQQEVDVSLDPTNTNIGYRLGRLFAVLEKIQEEANPRINATIRDRFYGAASSTPVTGFFVPMKLKNHHLAKLENRGRAVNLDRLIGEIVDGIADFPPHLDLPDQGRFAVGYYHQRNALFPKKSANHGGDTNV